MRMTAVELRHGPFRARVLPALGGALGRFDLIRNDQRQPLLRPAADEADDPLQAACFPMLPFCGRLQAAGFAFRGRRVRLPPMPPSTTTPQHGLVWRRPWQVLAQDAARLEIQCAQPAGDWPWPYLATQVFTLDDTGLGIELALRNCGSEVLPCGLGLHPFFPCTTDTRISAQVARRVRHDAAQIPCGHEPAAPFARTPIRGLGLDHSFDGWDGALLIEDGDRPRLRLRSDASRLHVYAPPGADFFCAEPMSHEVNAHALDEPAALAAGLQLLEPGGSARLRMRLELP